MCSIFYSRIKHCWVCFGTDDDEFEGSRDWVAPCKCRGSTRWVTEYLIYFKILKTMNLIRKYIYIYIYM